MSTPFTDRRRLAAAALALQVLVVALALADAPGRALVAVVYLLVVPGWAVVSLLRIDEPAVEWTLALAVSITLGTVVAQGLVWAGWWSLGAALGVLAAVTTPALLVQLARPLPAVASVKAAPDG